MERIRKHVECLALLACLLMILLLNGTAKEPITSSLAIPEENMLTVYTSHKEEVYGPIIKEFEERTGIWVQVEAGGTNELLERIAAEAAEGEGTQGDIMFGGGVDSLSVYSSYFQSYTSTQVQKLNPDYIDEESKWTSLSSLPIVFIYNNKLVYSAGTPRSWEELLDQRWKGKIAFADPRKSGTSFTALSTMLQILGEDSMEPFTDNLDGHISEDSGAVLDEVISGTRLIGITLEETALKRIAAGADIGMVYPKEGTSAVPDGCAILAGATHQKNAELFLEFTISEDVQQYLAQECYRRPVRTDIQTKGRQAFAEITYDIDWTGKRQKALLKEWEACVR
ncbi:MAG: ABC transporter substrate-binding protein [Lachnospiraceae bacterium]|nr:ABC transporter substrate-binding protein [Lachnospiraceae bacterium]